jgi:secretion/DNA translocation related TadE-like protein
MTRDLSEPRPASRWTDEVGSGSVLAVALVAAILMVVGMAIPVMMALAVKQRVVAAADAAALAAADTVSGAVSGVPCEAAARAAALNGAELGSCSVDGLTATVTAQAHYLGLGITVLSRAGPPGSREVNAKSSAVSVCVGFRYPNRTSANRYSTADGRPESPLPSSESLAENSRAPDRV